MSHDVYDNPLIDRYASRVMAQLWGPQRKFSTWRRLWVALAEAEAELGIGITQAQIEAMREAVDDIDFEVARKHEKNLRHDVMAHVHTFRDRVPSAGGMIHLGATSCYVTDNTDLILMHEALELVARRLVIVLDRLAHFAAMHRDLACLGFTHLQPAQPTTVGKRACLWAYDLVLDLQEVEHRLAMLRCRGAKGTTGTQASFLSLFDGNHAKVRELDRLVSQKMGFAASYTVTGQTYTRKVDSQVLAVLSGVSQSAHKICTDLRILQSRKELEEPFEENQIGSSAMAYKRNPMRAERVCGIARFVMNLEANAAATHATQWLERTLDDSANRRLVIPQAFLGVDAVLIILQNIASGMVVYPRVIARHLAEELPFMATENILMEAVRAGGDRQVLHERIRVHSQAAAQEVKLNGKPNDLLDRLSADPAFPKLDLGKVMNPSAFIGRAAEQVDEFIAAEIAPIRARYAEVLADDGNDELRV